MIIGVENENPSWECGVSSPSIARVGPGFNFCIVSLIKKIVVVVLAGS